VIFAAASFFFLGPVAIFLRREDRIEERSYRFDRPDDIDHEVYYDVAPVASFCETFGRFVVDLLDVDGFRVHE